MSVTAADLFRDLEGIRSAALQPPPDAASLARTLTSVYRAIFSLDFSAYDPRVVAEAAPNIISLLFDLRMALRDSVPGWQKQGLMTEEVQRSLRDVFRVARYAGDVVGEVMIGHQRLGEGESTRRAFTSPDLNTLAHASFSTGQPIPFRSGDVLMVRGTAHNSAAIARIGDTDSQFSHLGLVFVDDRGQPWVVESLIEEGAIINPLAKVLDHGLGRAVLFRAREPSLATAAAQWIHAHVRQSREPGGKPIVYDFSMQLRPYKRLFCSKLVRLAYERASKGRVVLPTFHTRFNRNKDFFRRIGVRAMETFAPGDMELEPHFHLVAEWQDYRATPRLRMQDLIMTKMFEWMEKKDYRFREDFVIRLISLLGRFAARLSEGAKDTISSVIPKVPSHMKRRSIATVAMLHKTAEPLTLMLLEAERESIARTGRPLHPAQVFERLEQLRIERGGKIGYLSGAV